MMRRARKQRCGAGTWQKCHLSIAPQTRRDQELRIPPTNHNRGDTSCPPDSLPKTRGPAPYCLEKKVLGRPGLSWRKPKDNLLFRQTLPGPLTGEEAAHCSGDRPVGVAQTAAFRLERFLVSNLNQCLPPLRFLDAHLI